MADVQGIDWGSVADWASAVATTAATITALYLANRDSRARKSERLAQAQVAAKIVFPEAILCQISMWQLRGAFERIREEYSLEKFEQIAKIIDEIVTTSLETYATQTQLIDLQIAFNTSSLLSMIGRMRSALAHWRGIGNDRHHEVAVKVLLEPLHRLALVSQNDVNMLLASLSALIADSKYKINEKYYLKESEAQIMYGNIATRPN